MKIRAIAMVLALTAVCLISAGAAQAQVYKTVDQLEMANGYMNVFELDGTTFLWGSGWGIADLVVNFSGSGGAQELTFTPNTIGDPDPYWYIGGGGPGAAGNKVMEANCYAQVDDGSLAGQEVHFIGNITNLSLTSAHQATIFVRDFAPDFSSVEASYYPVTSEGYFDVSLVTINDPARHVQWGVQLKGVNVWATDVEPFGNVRFGTILTVDSEDASWGEIKSLYR
jgi:hypothetical protein